MRPSEYYDQLVWERSPFTGMLVSPSSRISEALIREPRIIIDTDYAAEAATVPQERLFSRKLWKTVGIAACALLFAGWLVNSWSPHQAAAKTAPPPHARTPETAKSAAVSEKPSKPVPQRPVAAKKTAASISEPEEMPVEEPAPQPAKAAAPAAAPPSVDDNAQYQALLEEAKKSSQRKQIRLLKEAIVLNPDGDEALAKLSILLMEAPKTRREALTFAERAADANEHNAMAWLAIGYIHQMTGNPGQAKAAYLKCAAAPGPKRFVRDCRGLI